MPVMGFKKKKANIVKSTVLKNLWKFWNN